MYLSLQRSSLHRGLILLPALLITLLLAACGGDATVKTQPTPPPTPTSTKGQQLLAQTANALTSATTLQGIFDLTFEGQTLDGTLKTEIWNMQPDKNRTEVRDSSLQQISVGAVTVSDGKKLWQYDPAKKVVYTGPVPTNANGLPSTGFTGSGGGNPSQFILNLVQTIFTRSDGTLRSDAQIINKRPAYDVHVVPLGSARVNSDPNSADLDNFNFEGEIYIDKTTALPLRIDLNSQGIGHVILDLPKLVLNQPIPKRTFTFVTPAGTKVLPLQQTTPSSSGGSLSLSQAQQLAGYHLLSVPVSQSAYALQSVNGLGAPGNQIYTLNYLKGAQNFTIAQGKPLANLPTSGQSVKLRGTTGVLTQENSTTTLSWTEKGIGVRITGKLDGNELLAIAAVLS